MDRGNLGMDATFRQRRPLRNQALACISGFAAWGLLGLGVTLADGRGAGNFWAMLALMAGFPLVMAMLSLWGLAAYHRRELRVRGDRLVSVGVARSREIDLRGVTHARWLVRPGGALVLRDGAGRLAINFAEYEDEDRIRIIDHLRSALPRDVQDNWNLFAYTIADRLRRPPVRKPGPDEVLVHRGYWSRYFAPLSAAACAICGAAWWFTGEWGVLAGMLFVPGLWVLAHWSTPAEGQVMTKIGADLQFFPLGFLLAWLLIAIAGMAAHRALWPRQEEVDVPLVAGGAAWLAILLFRMHLADRRRSRQMREAADLAAKARGEAAVDPWRADGWEA